MENFIFCAVSVFAINLQLKLVAASVMLRILSNTYDESFAKKALREKYPNT